MRLDILAPIAAAVALATTAQAQYIGFSTTPDGYGSACIDPPTSFPSLVTLHVIANTAGLPGGGMTSAEFAIRWVDQGNNPPVQPYIYFWTPNPAAIISLGDPWAEGVNVAFSTCQSTQYVLLGSVTIINQGDAELRELRISAREPPTSPNFDCPLLTLCDAPDYTKVCVNGGTAYLNIARDPPAATDPDPADGATDVPLQVTLRWYIPPIQQEVCEPGTIWQNIDFGTNPDPPYFGYSFDCRCFPLPLLQPGTTYYWRIAAGTHTSPVWSFTTTTLVGLEAVTWGQVRSLFR